MSTFGEISEDLEYLEAIAEKERQSRFAKALRISREETEGMKFRHSNTMGDFFSPSESGERSK